MPDYINPPVEADASDLEADVYAFIQTFFPNWTPREGHVIVVLTEAIMLAVAENRFLASAVPPSIFRFFGTLVNILPEDETEAEAVTTWTMINSDGYTVPAGTTVRLLVGGDEYVPFETIDDFTVPNGQTATADGAILVRAAVGTGASGNGLGGTPELLDVLDYVQSVALVGTTSGGQDAEDDDTYLNRLSNRLQLLADRPILPRDFEIFVSTLVPGVERTLALDGYNPADGTYNNERMVTVVPIDENGVGVSSGIRAEAASMLEAAREVNFVINTMAPTTTAITISCTVRAYAGIDTTSLDSNITEAISNYLSPARWGQPGFGESRRWVKEGWDKVRVYEIATVINNVEGVNYIETAVLINGVNADLTLNGDAPLPAASPTVTITVNPA